MQLAVFFHVRNLASDQLVRGERADARLVRQPQVERLYYPGLPNHPQYALTMDQMGAGGTVLAIDVGSREAAFRALNAFDLWTISNNLGDAKSIVTHPASTTHQRLPQDQKDLLGITPGLVRLSVGLEGVDDLLADLDQALAQA